MHPSHVKLAHTIVTEWLKRDNRNTFDIHLKETLKQHKNAGAKDRRNIREACYRIFRIIPGLKAIPDYEKFIPIFQDNESKNPRSAQSYVNLAKEQWAGLQDSFPEFSSETYFPASERISIQLDSAEFVASHLLQPYTWIRALNGQSSKVESFLINRLRVLPALENFGHSMALPASVDLKPMSAELPGLWEVQDFSSQRTLQLGNVKKGDKVWDVCAGSGGKTLLFEDHYPDAEYYVSDVRESILHNLRQRRTTAGLSPLPEALLPPNPAELQNLTFTNGEVSKAFFDSIILDAPCSGSGTWGRQPEWLSAFQKEKIDYYARLQNALVKMATPYLKKGGTLLYITCSVYKDENEDHIQAFKDLGLELEQMVYFKGFTRRADTLFGMRLRKI